MQTEEGAAFSNFAANLTSVCRESLSRKGKRQQQTPASPVFDITWKHFVASKLRPGRLSSER